MQPAPRFWTAAPIMPVPVAGMPALREAVAENLRTQNGIPVQSENILITDGGQEALYLLMQTLLDPGDEILVPDPRYTSYDEAIHQAGATMVLVPTYPEDNFDLRAAEVEAAITPKTKAILIISPSNPTSAVVSPANLQAIAELARRHNLVVISDEIYDHYVYPPAEQLSVASLPGMFERTVTLDGFSKTYAMTGWRVGYLAAPADFIATLTAVKAATTGPLSAVSQYAALAAATGPQDVVAEIPGDLSSPHRTDEGWSARPGLHLWRAAGRVLCLHQCGVERLRGLRAIVSAAEGRTRADLPGHGLWREVGGLAAHQRAAAGGSTGAGAGTYGRRAGSASIIGAEQTM